MPAQESDVQFHLNLGEPPPEILEWAQKNIGETDENKVFMISELREMIFERGDVIVHRTDDAYLLKFLRARNFNLESAYKLVVNYYDFKQRNPEFHENVNPITLKFIGDSDVIQVLPYLENTGRRIMIYKFGNWDPTIHNTVDLFRATLSVLEIGSLEQEMQILGGVCIMDFENITMTHIKQVTPAVAQSIFEMMVTCLPVKTHAVHIIFESWVFDTMYKLFRSFINDRMKKRIFFHGNNVESLHKHIDAKYLPTKYGGTRPNYRYNKWIEGFRTNPAIVKEVLSLGYVIDKEDLEREFYDPDKEETK